MKSQSPNWNKMSYESFIRPGEAIQPAIDRASQQGGGKVSLLPGTHRTGNLYLKSNVELFLACGAVLEGGHTEAEYDALPDPLFAECHTDAHNRALLAAANAENIALTGYGVIEGNGPDFYEKKSSRVASINANRLNAPGCSTLPTAATSGLRTSIFIIHRAGPCGSSSAAISSSVEWKSSGIRE